MNPKDPNQIYSPGTIFIGLDAGSTTVKTVVSDAGGQVLFSDYRRHYADIAGTCIHMMRGVLDRFGDCPARLSMTGSAGMGIAERLGLPFVQEVVAAAGLVASRFPHIRTLVDIGGEDAKLIFFRGDAPPDIRMNGSCAGGTGAFIDQMAALLAVEVNELGALAEKSRHRYPIASRCGVFSKTDIQNLLSRNIPREDIAASVFHAVSVQIMTSLARGSEVQPGVLVCGGPFAFIPYLRTSFAEVAGIAAADIELSAYAALIPAWGAAVDETHPAAIQALTELISSLETLAAMPVDTLSQRLQPLFDSEASFRRWQQEKEAFAVPRAGLESLAGSPCYLGIDSGSTTTKIVVLDRHGRMVFRFYEKNAGHSLATVRRGLACFRAEAAALGIDPEIAASCATGYGEDLVCKAFGLDEGLVETMAHYRAATRFCPDVSFILDIGGQDMKAVFIENKIITRLEINEACSSGCGSFIDTFAQSLNCSVSDFATMACSAQSPCDLGTRCTVFMNSRVKQFLREGAALGDISAGLSYSVIHNCLQKVLKIKDNKVMGTHLMVQGGAFRNPSLLRALELETGLSIMITDHPELMGAYGAALSAMDAIQRAEAPKSLSALLASPEGEGKTVCCHGCENQCTVTRFRFGDGQQYYSGNKCEKVYTNRGSRRVQGVNLYEEKVDLLFNRSASGSGLRIGIPRALGIYENYPFWHSLLSACGFEVVLSSPSVMPLYESGISTVMSENICFPAKLTHGHVLDLVKQGVDRIFLPFVVYEHDEQDGTANTYNCPIVTGYSEVLKSAMDPASRYGIPIDAPSFSFRDAGLMKKACRAYIEQLIPGQLSKADHIRAFDQAWEAQRRFEDQLRKRAESIAAAAQRDGRLLVVLAGRPYHADPLIQHKIAGYIADSGADVITEDIARYLPASGKEVQLVMQWSYTNRIIKAAEWVAERGRNIQFVELTSFGCGPDAFMLEEISDLLQRAGKNACLLKIDDITNTGSMKLRLRSLIESLRLTAGLPEPEKKLAVHTPVYTRDDRKRRILMPWFGDFYSPFLPAMFGLMGYEAENLPPPDQESAEAGLKHSNNEVCYPATLVVGDFMKALESGKYRSDEIALAISQTGGQCRATNYLALLKKAMVSAGFDDIPVVSVGVGIGTFNEQPGFELKWSKIYRELIYALVFADILSQLYHATRPRAAVPEAVDALRDRYFERGISAVRERRPRHFLELAGEAAADFRRLAVVSQVPRVGVVGEIFVKYNAFGNRRVIKWLLEHGIEPVIPPITSFFLEGLASSEARISGLVERRGKPKFLKDLLERYVFGIIRRMEARVGDFPWYRPIGNPHEEASHAAEIINLNAQFGEGWLIPAEFARFARDGVRDVVSFQPFGCIANHIISKGIEKRTRELYPDLNLLFLDFDSGMSDANIFNRLHFIARHARDCMPAS